MEATLAFNELNWSWFEMTFDNFCWRNADYRQKRFADNVQDLYQLSNLIVLPTSMFLFNG